MPETPEAFYERARGALRTPPLDEWEQWPFVGTLVPKELTPPVDEDPPRHGVGGIGCRRCERGIEGALWFDDDWQVSPLAEPSGLPCVVLLETREHMDFHELPERMLRDLGPLLVRVQQAVFAIGDIANVHVCRWGDGSEHFHWWFMARPARLPQLGTSFAAIWDDVLPPLPEHVWRANLDVVRRELNA